MIQIILLIIYAYFGDKANQFCRRHILHLEVAYVINISNWLFKRALWGILIGWITIPIAIILWIFGVRG